jgi:hypothetical protein
MSPPLLAESAPSRSFVACASGAITLLSTLANDDGTLAALAAATAGPGAALAEGAATAPATAPPPSAIGSAKADPISAIRANTGSRDINAVIGLALRKLRECAGV